MEPEYEDSSLIEPSPEDEPAPEVNPAKRVWGLWPTVGFSLAIGFIILIVQVVMILAMVLANPDAEAMLDPAALEAYLMANFGLIMGLGTVITGILGTAAIVGVIKLRRGASITEYLGLRRVSFKTLIVIFFITLVLIAAVDGLSLLVDDTGEPGFDAMMYDTSVWPVLFWLAVVVFAPLFEEVVFRGFLFQGLRYSRFGAAGAIMVTSLVWAGLHVQYNISLMGMIFGMGLVLGYVRLKTKSLWSTLFIHGVYNLAATLAIVLNADSLFR